MDKTIKRTLFAAVALLCAGVTLEAAPINGSITIRGGAELNSTSVNTATQVTGWLNGSGAKPTVVSRSGNFTTYVNVGDSVTMAAPWMADSNPSDAMSLPSGELWRSSTITISCVSAPMAVPATTPALMANTHAR